MVSKRLLTVVSAVAVALLTFLVPSGGQAAPSVPSQAAVHLRPVCGAVPKGQIHCHSFVTVNSQNAPLAQSSPDPTWFGPQQLHGAYNLPCTVGGTAPQWNCGPVTTYSGGTIGIVIPNNNPNLPADLSTYSSTMGIAACPKGTPSNVSAWTADTQSSTCLVVVGQSGSTTSLAPQIDSTDSSGWGMEAELDVQTAHQMCQNCKILLVEANSGATSDLVAAVDEATTLGAKEVSMSWGGGESSNTATYNFHFDHQGVAYVAGAGDGGYETNGGLCAFLANCVDWPANTPHVVAAGGTSLTVTGTSPNFSYGSETAWSSGGSGCSSYQTAETWQTALSNWSQTGCGSHRAIGDVSISATNLAVYDSYGFQGGSGWFQEAGTSVSTPMLAAIFALAGNVPATKYGSEMPYEQGVYGTSLHDVTSGSNGGCGTIMCNAGAGYDGPTGLGSPIGTGAFGAAGSPVATNTPGTPTDTPTSTPTPTNTPTPTVTPTPTNTATPTVTPTPTNTPTATNTPTPSAPTAPQNLSASTASKGSKGVVLKWQAPASSGSASISQYNIYRGTASGGEALYTHVGGSVLSYKDTSASSSVTYYYKVSAVNSVGEGPRSNEASAKAR